ncbi:hypothetical protein CSPAE12_05875 [Colletotrichum incanum]|nr:hypothetical protein CSPAE12_05875 [Colletotrichum incanum]
MQHHICLCSGPCQPGVEVNRALDVGAVTGIWAIQSRDDHHGADVTHAGEDSPRRRSVCYATGLMSMVQPRSSYGNLDRH